jgi:hypothetical protein
VQENVTGQEIIEFFKEYCKTKKKLFIPDSPRQEAIADSLAEHYSGSLIRNGIEWFVDNSDGPFLVFDFAVQSKKIIDKANYESESRLRFRDIVQETRKRMEQ